MNDPNVAPTPPAAVDALVTHFTSQLEHSAAASKAQRAELQKLAKLTKDPALRTTVNDAVKRQADAAAAADALTQQIQGAAGSMRDDLTTLLHVAQSGW